MPKDDDLEEDEDLEDDDLEDLTREEFRVDAPESLEEWNRIRNDPKESKSSRFRAWQEQQDDLDLFACTVQKFGENCGFLDEIGERADFLVWANKEPVYCHPDFGWNHCSPYSIFYINDCRNLDHEKHYLVLVKGGHNLMNCDIVDICFWKSQERKVEDGVVDATQPLNCTNLYTGIAGILIGAGDAFLSMLNGTTSPSGLGIDLAFILAGVLSSYVSVVPCIYSQRKGAEKNLIRFNVYDGLNAIKNLDWFVDCHNKKTVS